MKKIKKIKKIGYSLASLILCGVTIFLSSCSALSELEQLGLMGWLELGAPLAGVVTPTPTKIPTPSPLPATTPEVTFTATLPPVTDILTSLPIINQPPSIHQIIDGLPQHNYQGTPIMLSYVGTPSAFAGIDSTEIIGTIDYIEMRTGAENTLFNQRDREELEGLLAGDEYFADILYLPISDAVRYAKLGYLAPIDHDELSMEEPEVYYTDVCEKNSPDEYTYFILPSFSTPYESSIVIYCNTDLLVRHIGDRDILAQVKDGQWDMDLMFKYISLAKEVLGEGFTIADTSLSRELLTGTLTACCYTDKTKQIAEYIADSFRYSDKSSAIDDFFNGKTVFYVGHTSDLRQFGRSADSYAILPLPCEDQYQEKYPVMYDSQETYVLTVPKTAVNHSQALNMMDMLAIGTKYQFRYDFIESMYSAYIRQSDSIVYTSVSRFDGLVFISPEEDNNQTEETEETENENDGV